MNKIIEFDTVEQYNLANEFMKNYSKENNLLVNDWFGAGHTYEKKFLTVHTFKDNGAMTIQSPDEEIIHDLASKLREYFKSNQGVQNE